MKTKMALACLAFGTLLGSGLAVAGEDADAVGTSTKVFVKDSAITTKIKTKLAADHLTSLGAFMWTPTRTVSFGSAALPGAKKPSKRLSRSPKTRNM